MPPSRATEYQAGATNPKAPDSNYCPGCRNHRQVFIDRQRHLQAGFFSALLDFYVCEDCDRKFTRPGLSLIVPGSFVIGAGLLFVLRWAQFLN